MNKDFVFSLVRHVLTFGGGFLVAKGFTDAAGVETLISGVMTAAGIFWSFWHHTPDAVEAPKP